MSLDKFIFFLGGHDLAMNCLLWCWLFILTTEVKQTGGVEKLLDTIIKTLNNDVKNTLQLSHFYVSLQMGKHKNKKEIVF